MIYSTLLHLMRDKSNYYRFIDYIKEYTVPKEIYDILKCYDTYFTNNPSEGKINLDNFITWYKITKTSSFSKEKHSIYNNIFSSLETIEPTEEEKSNTLEFLLEKDYSIKISDYLLKISEGDDSKSILDAEDMFASYRDEAHRLSSSDDIFEMSDIEDVLANHTRAGLDWRLDELNISLGPLRPGDFMIVTSRPDAGKTTFLCSESTFMAQQLPKDKDVFWANNEEVPLKVKQRIFQAACGMTKHDMEKDPIYTKGILLDKLGRSDRFKLYHDSSMTVRGVNNALTHCNPGLIIFDQLWKIDGFPGSHSEVDKMTKLFGWARALADKYQCPVINVHQADGSASGEAYIQMHQMYNSKTGIQGEADAILGIGKSFDPSVSDNTRFFHVSKNKLDGGPKSDPKLRNGKWQVEILPEIARFKGVY